MDKVTPETIDKLLSLALKPAAADTGDRTFLFTPNGWNATDITDKLRADEPTPRNRRGTVTLLNIGSFAGFVNRMKTPPTTVLFASEPDRKIVAIFDYHDPMQWPRLDALPASESPAIERGAETGEALVASLGTVGVEGGELLASPDGKPRWGRYRAAYEFPLSRQWKIWTDQNGKSMGQADFAQFVEDNLMDVLPEGRWPDNVAAIKQLGLIIADPAALLGISRSLKMKSDETVVAANNLYSGEMEVSYESKVEASDRVTGEKLIVPTGFVIGIPMFEGGQTIELLVRLRTKKIEKIVRFTPEIYQLEFYKTWAFSQECAAVSAKTGVPLFYGKEPDDIEHNGLPR